MAFLAERTDMDKREHLPEAPGCEVEGFRTPADRATVHRPAAGGSGFIAAGTAPGAGFESHGQTILRHKGAVLLMAAVCGLAAWLVSLWQRPVYQARTSLEIQAFNENYLNIREIDPTTDNGVYSPETLQTQIKILQEGALLDRVVDKLGLASNPEFSGKPGGFTKLERLLGAPPARPLPAREQAAAAAARNLKVRASGQTRLVEILYDSGDPQLAAAFANTLANEFIEQNLELRWQSTQKTGEWLTHQLGDLKQELEQSQEQLLSYAREAGLVFTSDKGSLAEGGLRQLQEELARAISQRMAGQAAYEAAEAASPESLPQVLDSATLSAAQVQLNDLQRQRAELSTQFTPAFYKVKNVEAQIKALEAIQKREQAKIIERLRDEYAAALRREKMVASAYGEQVKLVSSQAQQAVHYDMLKREVDTNRNLYDSMLQKLKEASFASAMRASNIRIVSPAKPPASPYKPNPALNLALGLASGGVLGVIFVLHRERAGRNIRAPGEAGLYLDLPELGVIPLASRDPEGRVFGGGLAGMLAMVSRGTAPKRSLELVTWEQKTSLMAESFRATLASLLFSGRDGNRPRVLVLTSPEGGAGKTTVASNLGIALAEINRRVLLIDGDFRKPRLHRVFQLPGQPGLGQLLREERPIEDYSSDRLVCATEIPGLYVLPSGPENDNLASLLYSTRMAELLWRFRLEFHTVLIDAAPMLLPDARILGRLADGVILVLRAGRTTREQAFAIHQRLTQDGTLVVGTILNRWEPRDSYYGYESYGRAQS
jgi:succinoglycan biosynthesis transport protein ExoP